MKETPEYYRQYIVDLHVQLARMGPVPGWFRELERVIFKLTEPPLSATPEKTPEPVDSVLLVPKTCPECRIAPVLPDLVRCLYCDELSRVRWDLTPKIHDYDAAVTAAKMSGFTGWLRSWVPRNPSEVVTLCLIIGMLVTSFTLVVVGIAVHH